MANTSAPPPPPKSNNGPFIGVAILMLLLTGALVIWKVGGSEEKPAPAPVTVAQSPAETVPDQIIPPPPPPPPSAEPDAGAPTTPKKVGGPAIGTGCPTCGRC